jgi:hypothetical protein
MPLGGRTVSFACTILMRATSMLALMVKQKFSTGVIVVCCPLYSYTFSVPKLALQLFVPHKSPRGEPQVHARASTSDGRNVGWHKWPTFVFSAAALAPLAVSVSAYEGINIHRNAPSILRTLQEKVRGAVLDRVEAITIPSGVRVARRLANHPYPPAFCDAIVVCDPEGPSRPQRCASHRRSILQTRSACRKIS